MPLHTLVTLIVIAITMWVCVWSSIDYRRRIGKYQEPDFRPGSDPDPKE